MAQTNAMIRSLIRSPRVQAAALTSGAAEEFARAYVGGTNIEQARNCATGLQAKGLLVSLAYLPLSESEAETPAILAEALDAFGDAAAGLELSVKPSSVGLRESLGVARVRLAQLCRRAAAYDAHITLEMQGITHYAQTLALWRDIHAEYPSLGLTLPVDIRRSERDLAQLAEPGVRLRLCVGSYPVRRFIGYRDEHEKELALVRLLRRAMHAGCYVMLATHHSTIIAIAQELAHRLARPAQGFEFQMFHGVRPLEHRRLADVGYQSRTYIPFGPAWFEYLATRIAARPRTLFSYLRAIQDKR